MLSIATSLSTKCEILEKTKLKSVITFADSDDQLVLFSSHLHFQHLTITLQVAKQLAMELDRQNLFLKLQ